MKTPNHTIDEYRAISGDVWQIYKKYFPDDANLMEYESDVSYITKKYDKNPRTYEFACNLLRVYHKELVELKQLRGIKFCWGL